LLDVTYVVLTFANNSNEVLIMKRRDFIKFSGAATGLVLIPAVNIAVADDVVKLSTEDAQAKALGYVEQTPNAQSDCANCAQSHGAEGAEWLGCNIFPGKEVKASGWCKVWSPRPA
jgi:hypothetical protein